MPVDSVTIITPTSGRPDAFAMLEAMVNRQTHSGERQWIVTTDNRAGYQFRAGQQVIERDKATGSGHDSLRANLLAALPAIEHDRILIMEDDDWYAPTYVAMMLQWLDSVGMAGTCPALYYNVQSRCYRDMRNLRHASLAQTGFTIDALDAFHQCVQSKDRFIDVEFWKGPLAYTGTKSLHPTNGLHVGIKGMPGKPGIGGGHRGRYGARDSPDLKYLRSIIGDDADQYVALRRRMAWN